MILITRPKTESLKLKNKLQQKGYLVHINTLSNIVIKKNIKPVSSKFLCLISSPRAAEALINAKRTKLGLPLCVIGNSSKKKLVTHGYKNIIHTSINSHQMYKYLSSKKNKFVKMFKGIEYLTGSITNKHFIYKLENLEYALNVRTVYSTRYKKKLDVQTKDLLRSKKIDTVLIYSKKNAEFFIKLLLNSGLNKNNNLTFVCMSKNIGDYILDNGYRNVFIAKKPDEKSMIDQLIKL